MLPEPASMETKRKVWNQRDRKEIKLADRGDRLDGWMLKKGPCRHCCLCRPSSFLPKEHHFGSDIRWPVWWEGPGLHMTPEGESLLISAILMIPFLPPVTGLGWACDTVMASETWRKSPLGRLSKGFCSLKENVEGDFLFCLRIWLSACVTWNQAKRSSQEAKGGQVERQRNLGSWCSWS